MKLKFEPSKEWSVDFKQHGLFNDLIELFKLDQNDQWPDCDWLNSHIKDLILSSGKNLNFIPDPHIQDDPRYYEQIIYETGNVPTRIDNWHDLFGGLIWILFPKTKTLLNKMHIEQINEHGLVKRSTSRNAITLLDECGILFPYNIDNAVSEQIKDSLKNHLWDDAFVTHRSQWGENIAAYMFGHANYEMATKPYLGLTGKALFLPVNSDFYRLSLKNQYEFLDTVLYQQIIDNQLLKNNKALSPMPFLGIPDWYEDNNNVEFYKNINYFRPKPQPKQRKVI
ncbi:DUF3025 domain-containing protein [Pseudoalteromonas sp. C2R02]|uniref:DUF3025 domain-containing protein n=1 Tax=Pseudoalteromonas sp. C2R02 TaxID=2841565 RepID=UPI001C09174F|nr:DUF3025 domain-containing protein [Pseudoalteromonas sp. C2R02]